MFGMENSRFFTMGGLPITVFTDNKTLPGMWNKDLEELANARVVRMFDKISHLNIKMVHKSGKENEGADCMSRYQVMDIEATAPEIPRNFSHTRWVHRISTRSEKLTIPADVEEILDAGEN